jgi:Bacterial regulatory proteins, luxR family
MLAAVAVSLRAVFESVFTFVQRPPAVLYAYLFWWQISAEARSPRGAHVAVPVVLGLMAEGQSNHGICERLFLGPKTVETHVKSIFRKLGLAPAPDDHRRGLAGGRLPPRHFRVPAR